MMGSKSTGQWLALALAAALVAAPQAAFAASVTGTGSVVKHDAYGTEREWGRDLVLPEAGEITRVTDGTYGFTLYHGSEQVAAFITPESAVGTKLPAGKYRIEPNVCPTHRHHHVEVTAKY
ncbi:hypothetical protein [Parvibaculum sp. MBR-TMA-1.3b-4.2]|jgi:hypothetical protein